MPAIDPFAANAFDTVNLTDAINLYPIRYGRVTQMGLFRDAPITTRTAMVERYNGVLTILPTKPVDSPPSLGKTGKRDVRTFAVPHIPHEDVVMPHEAQTRAFGTENQLDSLNRVMARKLEEMRAKHDITLEWLLMGALKGTVLDADGTTTIYNWFTEFGISQTTVSFALGTSTTAVRTKVLAVKRAIEDALRGEVYSGIHCLCSSEYFDALIEHPNVKTAYERWQNGEALRNDPRSGFMFAGITFEEYRGAAVDAGGTTRRFIASGDAHFFPLGTLDTFRTYYAPANMNEFVNTEGRRLYAKQEPRKFERGTDLWTESNPLPICLRPDVLVKGTLA